MNDNRSSELHAKENTYQPPQSVDDLLRRYACGERYFAGADIPDGANFQNVNLEGASFEGAFLSDADFRGANLGNVNFRNANLKCSDFRGADLKGAVF